MILSGIDIRKAVERYAKVEKLRKELEDPSTHCENAVSRSAAKQQLADWQVQPLVKLDPFTTKQLNPNSYNLRLAPDLLIYDAGPHRGTPREKPLDAKKDNPTHEVGLTDKGRILYPGQLYLGRTVEYTESWNCVPSIDGRSSLGRLGVSIHITAGFGDVGFMGNWTLEITVIHPVILYPDMEVCQISYQTVSEKHENYQGKYLGDRKPRASAMHKEFDGE